MWLSKLAFVAKRLAYGLLVILAVIVFNFVILRLAPGDPAMIMAGESGASDEKFVADVRAAYGLDKPIPMQLGLYLWNVAKLDLGHSYRQQRPNLDLIAERLPNTLLLATSALVMALMIGVTLGFIAARFRGAVDTIVSVLSLVFYAMPIFWVGLMGILVFSVQLDWLPSFGMRSIIPKSDSIERVFDTLRHLLLPMMTLALFYAAIFARLMRSSLLEVRSLDFVTTARAKGASPRRVWFHHMARNALLPVVSLAGVKAGELVGGSVLVETVFGWPGIGRQAFEAVVQRDYNLLLGLFIITSAVVIVINIIIDMTYSLLDPRLENRL